MGSTTPSEALRVLVIGAGSAGLLLGQIFKKAGIDATVFEQDASPTARPRDWNFGIYWAQSRIEECLTPELTALIDTVQVDASYQHFEGSVFPIYHGYTMELMKELPAPHAIRLKRRAWLDLLRTGVDVHYCKKLQSIATSDKGVTATFTDGTTESGTLLIGAEGAHSVTRNWLFQASPSDTFLHDVPISSFCTLTKLPRDLASTIRALHPIYFMTLDPSGQMTFVSTHDCAAEDPAEWVFMVLITWRLDEARDSEALATDGELLLDRVCELCAPLTDPFGAMVRGITRGTKAWYSRRLKYWPTRPWDGKGGRVTLAGDAAHAMTFHRGQGLGNAITDVAELQTHLGTMKAHTRKELAAAVARYEQEVWQRGYDAVMQNRDNSLALHDWEALSQSALMVRGVKRDAPWQADDA